MLDLSLDILFSPTEANMERARGSSQNHWLDGFTFLLIAIFFTVMLESLAVLLNFIFIQKGILIDPTISPSAAPAAILLEVAIEVAKTSFSTLISMVISVLIAAGLARLVGGKGNMGELFFVRVLYASPISVIGAGWSVVITVGAALATKLNQPAILVGLVVPLFCFLPLLFYFLYLDFLAVKVVYKLTSGQAVLVIFLPFILLLIPIFCCGFLLLLGPIVK